MGNETGNEVDTRCTIHDSPIVPYGNWCELVGPDEPDDEIECIPSPGPFDSPHPVAQPPHDSPEPVVRP